MRQIKDYKQSSVAYVRIEMNNFGGARGHIHGRSADMLPDGFSVHSSDAILFQDGSECG